MNDKELIDLVANIWLSNGGDAEGFHWCQIRIHKRIKELGEEVRKKEE